MYKIRIPFVPEGAPIGHNHTDSFSPPIVVHSEANLTI